MGIMMTPKNAHTAIISRVLFWANIIIIFSPSHPSQFARAQPSTLNPQAESPAWQQTALGHPFRREVAICDPVYSPQLSTNSAILRWLFSMPASMVGVVSQFELFPVASFNHKDRKAQGEENQKPPRKNCDYGGVVKRPPEAIIADARGYEPEPPTRKKKADSE